MFLQGLADLSGAQRWRFTHALLGFACVAAAALIGRTVGDSLFLTHFESEHLAYMYPVSATVAGVLAYGYGLLACRLPLVRLISLAVGFLLIVLLALRGLLLFDGPAARVAAYVVGDLVVNTPMLLFWSFAGRLFDPRSAKRLFGLVGAGGTVACLVAGLTVRPLASAVGTPNLLWVVIALLGGFLVVVRRVAHYEGVGTQPPDQTSVPGSGSYGHLLKTSQVRVLVILVVVATVAVTLVDYQFKTAAKQHFDGDALAAFFGTFYGACSGLALVIQLFLVHIILQRGGVFLGLAVLPIALIATAMGAALTSSFEWTIASKFVFQVFAFTIDSAAIQMLYLGVALQSRGQTRALADGIGKPFAVAIAGLLLVIGHGIPGHLLAIVTAAAAIAWIVFARLNHTAYVQALIASIGSHRFDASAETGPVQDKVFEDHLRNSILTGSDDQITYLLGVVASIDDVDWTPEYRALLDRDTPHIKVSAIEHLTTHGEPSDVTRVERYLDHADPQVRAAAINALFMLSDDPPLEDIERCLEDPHPDPRAAAIACLISSGDLDRLLSAGAALKAMLESTDPVERIGAARALSQIKRSGMVRPLARLLQDDDPDVVVAALRACRTQQDSLLFPVITPLLADPQVAHEAADALKAYDADVLDHLIPYIELASEEGAFEGAAGIPSILAEIGDVASVPVLIEASSSSDLAIRAESIAALVQIVGRLGAHTRYAQQTFEVARNELDACTECRSRRASVEGAPRTEILTDALEHQAGLHLTNALKLINLTTPEVDLLQLQDSVRHGGAQRSSALEVVDNIVKGPLKADLLACLDDEAPARGRDSDPLFTILATNTSDWVQIGALYAASEGPDRDPIRRHISHNEPVVRETALFALQRVAPQTAAESAEHLSADPSTEVRALAQEILNKSP
jgi:ATP/ADP translocase/HEAT repeat protein